LTKCVVSTTADGTW